MSGGLQIYNVDDGLGSPKTAENYRKVFKHFLEYSKVTPEALLTQDLRRIEDIIIGYIRFMDKTKHRPRGSINIVVSAIFHFLEMNDILINRRKVKRFLPPDIREESRDRAYSHEQINKMLSYSDERAKVIILLMSSTGMRMGALTDIKLSHLIEIPKYDIYKISVYANSPKDKYYTFTTPECKQAIDTYLDYRRRFGEIITDKAPLIREQFNIAKGLAAKKAPIKATTDSILWVLKQVLARSGQKDTHVMQSHGLRKFAITQMIKAKVDYNTREYIVGHKSTRGLDYNYDRTAEEDRLAEYLKAVQYLTISEESRLRLEMFKLQDENQDIRNDINQIKLKLGLPPTG